ncbi:MAG: hypothetical protein ACYTG5_22790, partial [Planctomycetota bacterium]
MANHKIIFSLIAIVLIAGLAWPFLQGGSAQSIEAWNEADLEVIEVEVDPDAENLVDDDPSAIAREEMELTGQALPQDDSERPRLGVHGRIVNAFEQPIAGAVVRIEVSDASRGFGGRGRGRRRERVREPFTTG